MIGAGQAGLSSAYFLRRFGFSPDSTDGGFVVLDGNDGTGGAWRHRWPSLRFGTAHHIHDLPGFPIAAVDESRPAAEVVADYYAEYERRYDLRVHRPAAVESVTEGVDGRLLVRQRPDSDRTVRQWAARAVVNATGTWTRPFWPWYAGRADFRGRQLHTADYRAAEEFRGKHVLVVVGGTSAIELLSEISEVTTTSWVTRRPPVFRTEPFTKEVGRAAVASVAERVRAGLPPASVVSVTGLELGPRFTEAAERGVYTRLPMFERVEADGVRWADGSRLPVDVILWCTGFRPALDHLAPLRLRTSSGGIRMINTRVADEPRLHLVGYGPSASTIGASRAGRNAARAIRRFLDQRSTKSLVNESLVNAS